MKKTSDSQENIYSTPEYDWTEKRSYGVSQNIIHLKIAALRNQLDHFNRTAQDKSKHGTDNRIPHQSPGPRSKDPKGNK